jgi:hypothetical protein
MQVCVLVCLWQIRALTRGQESMDEEESAAALKLLSDLSVSIPDLIDLMEGMSLWQVEVMVQDSLRKLVSSAVYTFVSLIEVRGSVGAACLHCTRGVCVLCLRVWTTCSDC